MKTLTVLFIVTGVFVSCQQKQYFTSSPEIDLIKKCDESYLKGDWTTNRSFYHDTATIYVNTWGREELTPDQAVEFLKTGVADYKEYTLAKDGVYEMVITPEGQHWVHNWTEWKGIHKNGKEVRVVANISWRVENSKVVFAGFIFDTLPGYLAAQADTVKSM